MQQENEKDIMHYRPLLFSIAYNMTGSIMDAEDMVQDLYAYWFSSDHSHVDNQKHYLTRAIINRCINYLKGRQKEREKYVGTWLPQPMVEKKMEHNPSSPYCENQLSLGFLFLLEKLNPLERAVLVLRESFEFSYPELSGILHISQDNCRQLLSRAKARLKKGEKKFPANRQKHHAILHQFLQACVSGDMEALISLLKEDIAFYSDGGGKVSAALHPLHGRETVLKFIFGILKKTGSVSSVEEATVNGLSGAIIYINSESKAPDLVIAMDVDEQDEKVQNLYFIRNPDKLQHVRKG